MCSKIHEFILVDEPQSHKFIETVCLHKKSDTKYECLVRKRHFGFTVKDMITLMLLKKKYPISLFQKVI
jgi:hypothetical protein